MCCQNTPPGTAGTPPAAARGGRLVLRGRVPTAYAWALADDAARIEFLIAGGWGLDGTRSNLDMGVKVPVVRLHTRLSPASSPTP